MTTVLSLDLAKNAGYAIVDDEGVRAVGSWWLLEGVRTTGKRAEPLDTQHVIQCRRLRANIDQLIRTFDVDVVIVEREFGRGSGSRLLVALYTAAQEAAFVAGVPCMGVTIGAWRKHVHGTAGETTEFYKSEALRICAAEGIDVPDADAAEARLIGRYAHETVRFHQPSVVPAASTMGRAA